MNVFAKLSPRFLLGLVVGLGSTSCVSDDESTECTKQSAVVPLTGGEPQDEQLHRAIEAMPGTYVASATWLDGVTPIEITTTLELASDTYELEFTDRSFGCNLQVHVPVHVTVETSDGLVMLDELTTWDALDREPGESAEDAGLWILLRTDPLDPAWLSFEPGTMWPDLTDPDDGAELKMHLIHRAGQIEGLLIYETQEIIGGGTPFYDGWTMLEWAS